MTFLTNHLGSGATTIARIYQERWQIELFFKSLKQLLRVRTFVGTSANALKTQMVDCAYRDTAAEIPAVALPFWLVAFESRGHLVRASSCSSTGTGSGWLDDPFQAPPALAGVHDGQLALGF